MRKTKVFFVIMMLACALSVVGCDLSFVSDHSCVYGEWEVIDEATCGMDGSMVRYCDFCDKYEIKSIEKTGHTVVIDPAVDATETSPGKTEGKHCSECGEIIVRQQYIYIADYSDPTKYSGDYAYNYLSDNYDNAEAMLALYDKIDEESEYFHSSTRDAETKKISDKDTYYAAEIGFGDLGLSQEEALAVWNAYRYDHPLYYWMSNVVSYTSSSLSLLVFEEYAEGDVRADLNEQIYSAVEGYINALNGKTDIYQKTLSFHDNIIFATEYGYEDDGVTPLDDPYAHSVLGTLIYGEGVCESYTKTFQLLLNFSGIENVYVSGYAREAHAWNLVKLDNDEWYWFDLTWDDVPKNGLGVRHSYFCVSDYDNVLIYDGAPTGRFGTILEDHNPDPVRELGSNFFYELPESADDSYEYDGAMPREEVIEINGLSYVICGADVCALVNINLNGDVVIPESITYLGDYYEVAMIGVFEDGMICSGTVILADKSFNTPNITSITIPSTIKCIWDYAFLYGKTVRTYIVDKDNDVYSSLEGVLFTKNLYTLIQYPYASNLSSYSVPGETVEIAWGAFGDGGNVFYPKQLKALDMGTGIAVIGAGHFGAGYRDETPLKQSEIIIIDGYYDALRRIFGFSLNIDSEDPNF